MSEITDAEVGEIDLAIVAYRDEGDWNVAELPDRSLDTVDTIARELRRYPGENGALAMLSVAEDFVLFVRAQGSLVRVLLSDVTASTDWTLARSAINHIGVFVDDEDDQAPAGDLAILADMGMSAQGHGRAARRLRPLPRGDPQRRRRQRRVRHQVRRAGRPLQRWTRSGASRWEHPMRAALAEARAGRRVGRRTHRRSGALRRPATSSAPGTTSASATATRPVMPRSSRCVRLPRRWGSGG